MDHHIISFGLFCEISGSTNATHFSKEKTRDEMWHWIWRHFEQEGLLVEDQLPLADRCMDYIVSGGGWVPNEHM